MCEAGQCRTCDHQWTDDVSVCPGCGLVVRSHPNARTAGRHAARPEQKAGVKAPHCVVQEYIERLVSGWVRISLLCCRGPNCASLLLITPVVLSQVDSNSTTTVTPCLCTAFARRRPLLVRGKKFDLRLYALVTTSTAPFTLYLFGEGFCKFCVQPFDLEVRCNTR